MMVVSGTPEAVMAAKLVLAKLDGSPTVGANGLPIGAGPDSGPEVVTKVYAAKYMDAFDLGNTVASTVPSVQVTYGPDSGFVVKNPGAGYTSTSGGGAASASGYEIQRSKRGDGDKRADAVILTGRPQDVDRAMELLASVDIKQKQILIEAKILDLTNDASRDIGVDWSWDPFQTTGQVNVTNDKINTIASGLTGTREVKRILTIGPTQLITKLNLAVTSGKAKLLANPKVAAVSGKAADVFIGDEVKYVISIETTPTGQNITTETARVGIELKTLAVVGPDNEITLQLHPEVSVISSYLKLSNGIALPQIARRFTDSTLRIKSGQTIAIGGLIKEQEIENMNKVPFLSDLPIIGKLFQHDNKSKEHSEVTMLITATVMED
jgi:type IV pilus assembly protein PilQ